MSTRAPHSSTGVIVRNEWRALLREKTFLLLLGIFLTMTFFSVYIGWSTRSTTNAIYHASVAYLATQSVTNVIPNPLDGVSPLLVFDNMLIYILLIGALLAVVIGHRSFIRERASGVLPLTFVRPVSKVRYAFAKLLGIFLALAGVVFATYIVSALSALLIPALHLSGSEFLYLLGFYIVSFLYLGIFAALGLLFAITSRNESTALFIPILLWVAVVFIVPELTTGQNPVALLNPITLANAFPDQGNFFSLMRTIFGPISIGQFYTRSALDLLRSNTEELIVPLGALVTYLTAATGISAYALGRHTSMNDLSL